MLSTNMSVNLTDNPVVEDGCFETDLIATKFVRVLAYSVVMFVSLAGNLIVIAVVWKQKRMRNTVNLFIVNMAVADLVVTLYTPRAMATAYAGYEWQIDGTPGAILCRISIFFNQVPMIASVLTVVAISLDRFAAVVFPLKPTFISTRSCKVLIVLTWLVALAIRLPTVAAVSLRYGTDKLYCYLLLDDTYGEGTKRIFYQFMFIVIFCVPFLMIVVLYLAIIVTLKNRKPLGHLDSVNSQERIQRRQLITNKKVLRMISAVVVAFWMCWCFYYTYLILFAYGIKISCDLLFLRLFLAHFNCALNPCLYATFSENYRKGFRKIITGCVGFCKCPPRAENTPLQERRRSIFGWNSNGSISIKIVGEIHEMSEIQTHQNMTTACS